MIRLTPVSIWDFRHRWLYYKGITPGDSVFSNYFVSLVSVITTSSQGVFLLVTYQHEVDIWGWHVLRLPAIKESA